MCGFGKKFFFFWGRGGYEKIMFVEGGVELMVKEI